MSNMNDKSLKQIETYVRETAVHFSYPPTPDLSAYSYVNQKATRAKKVFPRWTVAFAALVLLLSGLLMVPQVRAAVLRIFHAGAITIFESESSSSPTQNEMTQSFTPFVSDYGVTISLVEAQASLKYGVQQPLALPQPDQFVLDSKEQTTMLVSLWLDESSPDNVIYSLYQIEVANFAAKGANIVAHTEVNHQDAFWIEGPHVIRLEDGRFQSWLFVEGNVLIWWDDALTFRLEGAMSLAEAITIAESLAEISTQE